MLTLASVIGEKDGEASRRSCSGGGILRVQMRSSNLGVPRRGKWSGGRAGTQ